MNDEAKEGRFYGSSGSDGEIWHSSREGTGEKCPNLSLFPYSSFLLVTFIG